VTGWQIAGAAYLALGAVFAASVMVETETEEQRADMGTPRWWAACVFAALAVAVSWGPVVVWSLLHPEDDL